MHKPETSRLRTITGRHSASGGFTLIELLVAMAVLVIIVLIVSMIFTRASTVWDTGMNKAELDMTGRAVADYVAQELSAAIPTNTFTPPTAHSAHFIVLSDTGSNAFSDVDYEFSGGALSRNGTTLAEGIIAMSFSNSEMTAVGEMPRYVDVTVTVTNQSAVQGVYQSRAYFVNRNRYKL